MQRWRQQGKGKGGGKGPGTFGAVRIPNMTNCHAWKSNSQPPALTTVVWKQQVAELFTQQFTQALQGSPDMAESLQLLCTEAVQRQEPSDRARRVEG